MPTVIEVSKEHFLWWAGRSGRFLLTLCRLYLTPTPATPTTNNAMRFKLSNEQRESSALFS
eukprot:scaffold1553_cov119-Skeletonema_menzelii.AAC.6